MHTIITMLARALARRYQEGSTAGAIWGAVLGALGGIGFILFQAHRGAIESPYGPAITLAIFGAMLFSFIGSIVGPKPTLEAGQQTSESGPIYQVRFFRVNQALVPLPFAILTAAFAFYVIQYPRQNAAPSEQWLGPGAAAISAVIILYQGFQVLWVTVDAANVTLFRLFKCTRFKTSDITDAGFEVRPGQLRLDTRILAPVFVIAFRAAHRMEIAVPPHKAAPLVKLLQQALDNRAVQVTH